MGKIVWSKPQKCQDHDRYLHRGPFIIDFQNNQLYMKGQPVDLPYYAYCCFVTLARHSPKPVTFSSLVEESLGVSLADIDAQDYARWRIEKLRKAIEANPQDPRYITLVPGYGYRLDYGNYY